MMVGVEGRLEGVFALSAMVAQGVVQPQPVSREIGLGYV